MPQCRHRRFVVVRQRRGNDCGVAALATVMLQYGWLGNYSLLERSCQTTHRGITMRDMAVVARGQGFEACGFKGSYPHLQQLQLPLIAHLRHRYRVQHFVVIHEWTATSVILADPAAGLRTMTRNAFTNVWSGYLLALVPTHTG